MATQRNVLIVDDDPVVQTLLSECLLGIGHTVTITKDGAQCREHLGRFVPDVIFLDMIMPDISGAELLQWIRANQATAKIPVIMLSADQRMATKCCGAANEPDLYLEKPFDLRQLDSILDRVLGSK